MTAPVSNRARWPLESLWTRTARERSSDLVWWVYLQMRNTKYDQMRDTVMEKLYLLSLDRRSNEYP